MYDRHFLILDELQMIFIRLLWLPVSARVRRDFVYGEAIGFYLAWDVNPRKSHFITSDNACRYCN
jgi:hypothetical protein